jgi:hypothetical protein
MSSTVGLTHRLSRSIVLFRTALGIFNNAEISVEWHRSEVTDGREHLYRAGFQIAIQVPNPGATPGSRSEAITYLCNPLLSR